jgi:hypothetical protein
MADLGAKITKDGVNVLTATSPNDFVMHSSYPFLKVHSSGSFNQNWTGGSSLTIYHNLGYKPFVKVYMQWYDGVTDTVDTDYRLLDVGINGAIYQNIFMVKIYTDRIVIYVSDTNLGRFVNLSGFFFIFKDEI